MKRRKLQALRNLAERPGTEAEGAVARAMLEKAEAEQRTPEDAFADYLHTHSLDDLADAVSRKRCRCGNRHPAFTTCPKTDFHASLDAEKREKFPRGARVHYNYWAYAENCPGNVVGYSKEWGWIRIKFDHLKHSRSVPIYTPLGWHLSTVPLDRETLRQIGLRGGMERFERATA